MYLFNPTFVLSFLFNTPPFCFLRLFLLCSNVFFRRPLSFLSLTHTVLISSCSFAITCMQKSKHANLFIPMSLEHDNMCVMCQLLRFLLEYVEVIFYGLWCFSVSAPQTSFLYHTDKFNSNTVHSHCVNTPVLPLCAAPFMNATKQQSLAPVVLTAARNPKSHKLTSGIFPHANAVTLGCGHATVTSVWVKVRHRHINANVNIGRS